MTQKMLSMIKVKLNLKLFLRKLLKKDHQKNAALFTLTGKIKKITAKPHGIFL
jgi:hypothetical protein